MDLELHLKLHEKLDRAEARNHALERQLEAMHASNKDIIAAMRRFHGDIELMAHEFRGHVIKTGSARVNVGRDSRHPAR